MSSETLVEPTTLRSPFAPPLVDRRGGLKGAGVLLGALLLIPPAAADVAPRRSGLSGWVAGKLETELSRALGGEVRIGGFELSPTSLEARFSEVTLTVPSGDAKPLSARLSSGRLKLPWAGVAAFPGGRIRFTEVVLDRPTLTLDHGFVDAYLARKRERRPVSLRIDRVVINHGRVNYQDREMSLELDASDVELTGAWSDFGSELVGQASASVTIALPTFRRPYPVQLRTGFRLSRGRMEFQNARGSAPGLSVELGGRILWGGTSAFTSMGRAECDLAALGGWLRENFPPIAGNLDGSFRLDRSGGPVHLTGRFRVSEGRLGPLTTETLVADTDWRPGMLKLTRLDARGYGGTIQGDVEVALADPLSFRTTLHGEGLRSEPLFALAGLPLPLSSRTTLDLVLAGEPSERRSWSGSGSVDAEPVQGSVVDLPMGGRGNFEIERGRLIVNRASGQVASASLRLDLDVDLAASPAQGTLLLEGTTTSADRTRSGTRRILESLRVPTPDLLQERLSGAGSLRANVAFGRRDRLDLDLRLAAGDWLGQAFDVVEVSLGYGEGILDIGRLWVRRGDQLLEGSARIEVEPLRVVALETRAQGVALAPLLERFDVQGNVEGQIDGSLRLQRAEGGISGEGAIELREGAVFGERIESARSGIEVRDGIFVLPGLHVKGPAFEGSGRLTWDPGAATVHVDLAEGRLYPGGLEGLRSAGTPASGTVSLEGGVRITSSGPEGELTLASADWRVDLGSFELGSAQIGEATGRLLFAPEGLDLALEDAGTGHWAFDARLGWEEDLPFVAKARILDFPIVLQIGDVSAGSILLAGDIDIVGPLARPKDFLATGSIDRASIQIGDRTLETEAPVPFRMDTTAASLGPFRLVGEEASVDAGASIRLSDGGLDAFARGTVDLSVLIARWPELRARGPVRFDLRAGGTPKQPDLLGSVDVAGASIRLKALPYNLESARLRLILEGQTVRATDFRAFLGGGEIRGSGEATLSGLAVAGYKASFSGANIRAEYPAGFKGIYEGSLTLEGSATQARLSGRVVLLSGLYREEFAVANLIRRTREYAPAEIPALFRNVDLDIDARSDGNLWIRNRLARLESRFDIHIGGQLARPEITGRAATLEGGRISFRDVEYTVVNGTLDFDDPDRFNPYLDLQAQSRVQEYEIFLHAEGTLDRIEYELTSSPPLDEQDIVSLLLTGETPQDWATGGRLNETRGDVAASYFADALGSALGSGLQGALNLETVRINPMLLQGESDPTTRITLGKRVAENVQLVYSTDLGTTERQLYQVEWEANRKVRLLAKQDTTYGLGGDVTYSDRYNYPGTKAPTEREVPRAAAEGAPAAVQASRQVSVVDLVGIPEEEARTLRRKLPIKTGDPLSRSKLLEGVEKIHEYFARRGRLESRVDPDVENLPDGSAGVTYTIDPGPRVEVSVEGVRGRTRKRLEKAFAGYSRETPYNESFYLDAADVLRGRLVGRGIPGARVDVEVGGAAEIRQVVFRVEAGGKVKVDSVVIVGAESLSSERVRRQILTEADTMFTSRRVREDVLEADASAIRGLYLDQGFLQVQVDPPRIERLGNGDTARVVFTIHEGPQYLISSIEAPEGLPYPAATLVRWSGLTPGGILSGQGLIAAEGSVRSHLDEAGYPDARVRASHDIRGTTGVVKLSVEPGSRKTVGAVQVEGNRRTLPKYVTRELALGPGDPISRAKLIESQRDLYRLGIFRSVHLSYEPISEEDPGLNRLQVRVEETKPLAMTLGAGWDSEQGARGLFSVTDDNVGGRDRSISLQARLSQIEERVGIVAKDPRLFQRRLPTLVTVFQEKIERDAFTERRKATAARIEKRNAPHWLQYIRYNYQRVDITDVVDPEELIRQKLTNLRLGDLGYVVARESRDDPFAPTRGGFASVDLRFFHPVFLSTETFLKSFLRASAVKSLASGISFLTALRIGASKTYGDTLEVPISERFFAGGDSTLRGFPRDGVGPKNDAGLPVGGEALVLFNQEFRFPIWGHLKGLLFYDAGNVYATVDDVDLSDIRQAYGGGLRFETPIGPLRFEYGRKIDREPGESAGEFYIAIGVPY